MFMLEPITRGSAHVLVSTRGGERFQGTPIAITVEDGTPLPATTCSVVALDIDEQQGCMHGRAGGCVAVLASSSGPSVRLASVWLLLSLRDEKNRPVVHMSVPELRESVVVKIGQGECIRTHVVGPLEFQAQDSEGTRELKMRVPLKCLAGEGDFTETPFIWLQSSIRLTVQLQGQAFEKSATTTISVYVMDSKASWWWHVKRELPNHVVVPQKFVFEAPAFHDVDKPMLVNMDLIADADAREVVEAGALILERLHGILKPSAEKWRDVTCVGLQPWLNSLALFSGCDLDGEVKRVTTKDATHLSFSQWLRNECKASPRRFRHRAAWGHLLLCKMVVDQVGLFRCFLADGKCWVTGETENSQKVIITRFKI